MKGITWSAKKTGTRKRHIGQALNSGVAGFQHSELLAAAVHDWKSSRMAWSVGNGCILYSVCNPYELVYYSIKSSTIPWMHIVLNMCWELCLFFFFS